MRITKNNYQQTPSAKIIKMKRVTFSRKIHFFWAEGRYLWVADELPVQFCVEGLHVLTVHVQNGIAHNADLRQDDGEKQTDATVIKMEGKKNQNICKPAGKVLITNKPTGMLPLPVSACTKARLGPNLRSHLLWTSGQWTSAETSGSTGAEALQQNTVLMKINIKTGASSYLELLLTGPYVDVSPPDHQSLSGSRLAGCSAVCARLKGKKNKVNV